mgnify:CR=1 FL=1
MSKTIKGNEAAKERAAAIREYRQLVRNAKSGNTDDDLRKTWSDRAELIKKEYGL